MSTHPLVTNLGSALEEHKKARAVHSVLKKQKSSSESQTARLGRQDVIIPNNIDESGLCETQQDHIKVMYLERMCSTRAK